MCKALRSQMVASLLLAVSKQQTISVPKDQKLPAASPCTNVAATNKRKAACDHHTSLPHALLSSS